MGALWSRGNTLASGAKGPGFDPQLGRDFFSEFLWLWSLHSCGVQSPIADGRLKRRCRLLYDLKCVERDIKQELKHLLMG